MVINGAGNGTIRLNFRSTTVITKWRTGWSLLEFCEITLIDEMDSRGKMEERGKQRETEVKNISQISSLSKYEFIFFLHLPNVDIKRLCD